MTETIYNGTQLHFKGHKILEAILDTLKNEYDLAKYDRPVLAGCSAGGLATYLHCDEFADYVHGLNSNARTQCIADAGYFPDMANLEGEYWIRTMFQWVYEQNNATGGVDASCMAAKKGTPDEWQCYMAQYTVPYLHTPIFALNSG